MKMTLARALKYKNRVVNQLSKLRASVAECNSIIVGRRRDVDIVTTMIQQETATAHLIALKRLLTNANHPIQPLIVQMQELKGQIAWLVGISTVHGTANAQSWRAEAALTYEAILSAADIAELVKEREKRIDEIQEQLDAFNHTTQIDIDPIL